MITFSGKVTSQLSTEEFEQISTLFSAVFSKHASVREFRAKYRSPHQNESYHALMKNDTGLLLGFMAIIPFTYSFFGTKAVFGNLVDLMIHPDCRKDITLMKKMYDAALGLTGNAVDFLYAIPNRNPYLYFKKILGWREIGQLHYFALPLTVSKLSPRFTGLDFVSKTAAMVLNRLPLPVKASRIEKPVTRERTPAFDAYRFPPRYRKIERSGQYAWYIIVNEESATTAYLIDVWPLYGPWLRDVIRTIWRNERRAIDLVLYVGTEIPCVPNLFEVPPRYEPRALPFIGKVINSGNVDDRIHHISHWQFNLSDFDVR